MINKGTLVEKIAETEGITKASAGRIVTLVAESIKESVAAGEKVTLTGFGTFETVERSARTGINPATGEKILIPASKAVKFKAGKAFKEAVNI